MATRHLLLGAAVAAVVTVPACKSSTPAPEAPPTGDFSTLTIDLGTVVGDIEKSAAFYTEVVGFQEVPGFDVPAAMGADAGLTDGASSIHIRVFTLGEGHGATKLKLMQFKGAPGKKPDNAYIHSTLGYRYLTIRVKDMNAAMARLKKAGIKPLAKGPYALPQGFPQGIYLTCVKDPDGNMVELVGPKP